MGKERGKGGIRGEGKEDKEGEGKRRDEITKSFLPALKCTQHVFYPLAFSQHRKSNCLSHAGRDVAMFIDLTAVTDCVHYCCLHSMTLLMLTRTL